MHRRIDEKQVAGKMLPRQQGIREVAAFGQIQTRAAVKKVVGHGVGKIHGPQRPKKEPGRKDRPGDAFFPICHAAFSLRVPAYQAQNPKTPSPAGQFFLLPAAPAGINPHAWQLHISPCRRGRSRPRAGPEVLFHGLRLSNRLRPVCRPHPEGKASVSWANRAKARATSS